jgi:hypothetical protein
MYFTEPDQLLIIQRPLTELGIPPHIRQQDTQLASVAVNSEPLEAFSKSMGSGVLANHQMTGQPDFCWIEPFIVAR